MIYLQTYKGKVSRKNMQAVSEYKSSAQKFNPI